MRARRRFLEGKNVFIKAYMARDIDATGIPLETKKSALGGGVANEDTRC